MAATTAAHRRVRSWICTSRSYAGRLTEAIREAVIPDRRAMGALAEHLATVDRAERQATVDRMEPRATADRIAHPVLAPVTLRAEVAATRAEEAAIPVEAGTPADIANSGGVVTTEQQVDVNAVNVRGGKG